FPTAPSLPPLMLNLIHQAVLPPGTTNQCGASPAAAGQFCVPPNPGGTPFLLQNLSPTQSTAQFRFSGITGESGTPGTPDFHKQGESLWTATFTAPFNTRSFQQVLKDFTGPAGKVSTSYAGNFTVVITP